MKTNNLTKEDVGAAEEEEAEEGVVEEVEGKAEVDKSVMICKVILAIACFVI